MVTGRSRVFNRIGLARTLAVQAGRERAARHREDILAGLRRSVELSGGGSTSSAASPVVLDDAILAPVRQNLYVFYFRDVID